MVKSLDPLRTPFTPRTQRRAEYQDKIYKGLLLLAVPVAIAQIVYAVLYGIIQAREGGYVQTEWQRCVVAPNKGDSLDQNNFAMSAASFAGRVFVFIIVAFKASLLGLKDPELIPYSFFATMMAVIGMTVYREATPIQPAPNGLSATLPTLMKYIHPEMYVDLKSLSADVCHKAYAFNHGFLVVQYMTVALGLGLLSLSLWNIITMKARYTNFGKLKGDSLVMFFALFVWLGYLASLVSKEIVAQKTLDLLREDKTAYIFPFCESKMDPVTLTMMVTLGSIGVGSCKAFLQNFKIASLMALVNIGISYPSVVATLVAYHSTTYYPYSHGVGTEYGLWNKEQCVKYIEIKQARQTPSIPNFFAVDPSSAEIICGQLAVSLIAQLVQFIAVHFLVFTCVYILWANQQVAALLTMQRYENFFKQEEPGTDEEDGGILGISENGEIITITRNGYISVNAGFSKTFTP